MIAQGRRGRIRIRRELEGQRITFPSSTELPEHLARYAGTRVRTAQEARIFADVIAAHIKTATEGRTYAEINEAWIAGARKDQQLAQLQHVAFTGECLRSALMGTYLAGQVTCLAAVLGGLLTGIGAGFVAIAAALRPSRG
ncbi:MAG: hypothetical protein GEV06_23350 [Luteitalea sp.]|nr:hypothetical protein [Luteitalea sp.]